MLYRLRLRQVAARVRLDMEARHQERERIARDLHDTILQETQGLVLGFQALAGRLPADGEIRRSMEGLLDHADNTLVIARQSVSGLRASESEQASLVDRFEALAAEFAHGEIPVKLSVRGEEPSLPEDSRNEVYRVGREAVLNALRHSSASVVTVALTFETQRLRMIVQDDGVGILDLTRESAGRPGHWGLVGMRERAARIGAELSIRSVDGRGTTIELGLATGDGLWRRISAIRVGDRLRRFLSA
ncbi:MAG: histidine kinase [Caldimonas sp.]